MQHVDKAVTKKFVKLDFWILLEVALPLLTSQLHM